MRSLSVEHPWCVIRRVPPCWESERREREELSAQAASFGESCSQAGAFQTVGMTTETFSNQLKSHRKAEAFRGKVIKRKQGRGKQMAETPL